MSYRHQVDEDRSQVTLAMGKVFLFPPSNLVIDLLCIWLCWISVAAHGLSLVAASGGHPLGAVHELLITVAFVPSTALGARASVVAAHGLGSDSRA